MRTRAFMHMRMQLHMLRNAHYTSVSQNHALHSHVSSAGYNNVYARKCNVGAEETTRTTSGWVLGAIASAVAGVALLGISLRKQAQPVATSVPV